MDRRARRGLMPEVDRMEARCNPSSSAFGATGPSASAVVSAILNAQETAGTASTPAISAADANSGSGSGSGSNATPPIVPGQGTPTRREAARERFTAAFSGPFSRRPGRFTDQSAILYFSAVGTSNDFLHGDMNMAIVLPKDPSASITGAAYLEDKNNNNGAAIGLDLVADPKSLDGRGRPTRLTFTPDPNIYGGTFYFASGSGTVNIRYLNNGKASVAFKGQIYTSLLTNPTHNSSLYYKS